MYVIGKKYLDALSSSPRVNRRLLGSDSEPESDIHIQKFNACHSRRTRRLNNFL